MLTASILKLNRKGREPDMKSNTPAATWSDELQELGQLVRCMGWTMRDALAIRRFITGPSNPSAGFSLPSVAITPLADGEMVLTRRQARVLAQAARPASACTCVFCCISRKLCSRLSVSRVSHLHTHSPSAPQSRWQWVWPVLAFAAGMFLEWSAQLLQASFGR